MIEIRYLRAESGANKFGTCNCCGKSSSEDPLMISVKFSYYGHGTLICLCDDCKKKLTEALPPANCSEIPNNSDTIGRQAAINALGELITGSTEGGYAWFYTDDVYKAIKQLPPAQPERIKGHWIEHDDGLTACECSVCHEKYALYEEDVFGRNFCPNCGAEMEVTE